MAHARVLVLTIAAVLMSLFCPACDDPHADDKAAVRAALRQIDTANRSRDGEAAVAVMCRASLDEYTRIVQIALDGKPDEVRRLPPHKLALVFELRNRLTRRELQGMDGRAYQAYATSAGWYDAEWGSWEESVGRIEIDGDRAVAYILDDRGGRTGDRMHFVFEDGMWKVNEFTAGRSIDEAYEREAGQFGMTVENYLILLEEEISGKQVRSTIWQPMK